MGFWSWGFYNKRRQGTFDRTTQEAVSEEEASRLRQQDRKVPDLEASVIDLGNQLGAVRREYNAHRQQSEQKLGIEQQAAAAFSRQVLSLAKGLISNLNLEEHLYSDNPVPHLEYLREQLRVIAPYFSGIVQNLQDVRATISGAEQQKNHQSYRGSPDDYIRHIVANTRFDNPDSVYASAGLMSDDLKSIRRPHSIDLDFLVKLASNEGTRRMLEVIGPRESDELLQRALREQGDDVAYNAAFDYNLAPLLSQALRASIAQDRMRNLPEEEYGQIPNIILRARDVMGPEQLQESVKAKLVQELYKAEPNLVCSLLQNSVLQNVLGEGYDAQRLLSDAINSLQVHVRDARSRLPIYEKLHGISAQLIIPVTTQDSQSMARGYVGDVLHSNDRRRFDDAITNRLIIDNLGTNGIIPLIASYVSDRRVPHSAQEAAFSIGLISDYQNELMGHLGLGPNSFPELFRRHSANLELDALVGLISQPIYANTGIMEIVDGQINSGILPYFTNPKKSLIRDSSHLSAIIRNSGQLPATTRGILLTGILSFETDGESRARYIEQLLQNIARQESLAIFDAVINGEARRLFTEHRFDFGNYSGRPLMLLQERAKYIGTEMLPNLLSEVLTAREPMSSPQLSVRMLEQIAGIEQLKGHLTDEAKNTVFASYIGSATSAMQQARARLARYERDEDSRRQIIAQNNRLTKFVADDGYMFPQETVGILFNYYLSSNISRDQIPPISRELRILLDNIRIQPAELGAVIYDGIKRLVFDEERSRTIPLSIETENSYVDLIFEHRGDIPTDKLSELANHSLRSITASSHAPTSYAMLKKFDAQNLSAQVEDSVRGQIYVGMLNYTRQQIERSNMTIADLTARNQRYDTQRQNLERELERLATFVESDGDRLSTEHLALALGASLLVVRQSGLQYARRILQQASEPARIALGNVVRDSFNALNPMTQEHFKEQYKTHLEGLIPNSVLNSL